MKKIVLVFVLALVLVGCNKTPKLVLDEADAKITLTIGEEKVVTPLVERDAILEWESSNNEIATVSEGKITGIASGEAIIIVAIAGTNIKEEISVIVIPPNPISIEIEGQKNLKIGEKIALTAIVHPQGATQDVIWESSNPKIANVDSKGTVTAFAPGEVTITAITKSTKVKKSIIITVMKPEQKKITIEGPKEVIIMEEVSFKASIVPEEADQRIRWFVEDESIATITEEGVLIPKKVGTIKVFAQSVENSNLLTYLEVTIIYQTLAKLIIDGLEEVEITEKAKYFIKTVPDNACPDIIWVVDNPQIAKINADGILTPLSEGICIIRAISMINQNISCSKEVIIYKKPTNLFCNIPTYFITNGFGKLNPTLYQNENIITPYCTFESSNHNILEINHEGSIIAKQEGTAIITVSATYNPELIITKEVIVTNNIPQDEVLVISAYQDKETFIYQEKSYIKGYNAFSTIQEAINYGKKIILTEGNYKENIIIDKNNLTLTGNDAYISSKIFIKGNNITIDGLHFNNGSEIYGNSDGKIANFTFTNNEVKITEGEDSFLTFVINSEEKNNNFIITNNQFSIDNIEAIIRLNNIENVEIKDNLFKGSVHEAILFHGKGLAGQETTLDGIGASGIIEIENNIFENINSQALHFALLSANTVIINNNEFYDCGNGILFYLITSTPKITINYNTFNHFKKSFGIRFIASENAPFIVINYNKFLSIDNFYIDNWLEVIVDGNYNYYDKSPSKENINNATYTITFSSIEELEAAIKSLG